MPIKSLDEVLRPDDRHFSFVQINENTGERRQISIADYHAMMSEADLSDAVPEKIRKQFDKARLAFIFCWFEYELSSLAEQHAYATLELALKTRMAIESDAKKDIRSLRNLMKEAIARGWLTDEGLSVARRDRINFIFDGCEDRRWPMPQSDPQAYCRALASALPELRNSLAHGSPILDMPGSVAKRVQTCAELINQLFQPKSLK